MNPRFATGGTDRAAFLARVKASLGRSATQMPTEIAPVVDEATARVVSAGEDLAGIFARHATGAGMVVHRTSQATAAVCVLELLGKLGARRVAVGVASVLAGVRSGLESRGMQELDWRAGRGLEPLYDCDAGVTDVQAAIAETGTLVCWSGPERGRGLSLVPPLHVAVVRMSDIVPDLIDYLRRHSAHGPGELRSSIVLITGPSKTADIEGVLITGVHGPREVHIVLVDGA